MDISPLWGIQWLEKRSDDHGSQRYMDTTPLPFGEGLLMNMTVPLGL